MSVAFRTAGVVLAALLLLATSWASTAPLRVSGSGDAVLRISLGARPERIETCRTVADEELARVAPQMRQQVICEGTTARYSLEVRRDGALLHSQVVRGGGLRHDRQLYVSRDIRVPPGAASYRVDLVRLDTVPAGRAAADSSDAEGEQEEHEPGSGVRSRAVREAEERRRRREEAVPAALRLDVAATLAPREVLLVSYDPERRRLVTRRAEPAGR